MNIPHTESFKHNGKAFEILVTGQNSDFQVYVTLDGSQVSPVYSVSIQTHQDFFAQHKGDLVDHLITIAKSDIEQGMYYEG
jgi:hypothetical protein